MNVSNHVSQSGTYEDLRGFLLDHAGHRVVVEIDAHKAMDGVAVFRAQGILRPLTLDDHEDRLQMLDDHMAAAGYDGYEDRDHSDELTDLVGHHADFRLVDSGGYEIASMEVWEPDVRDVTIGRLGEVAEHQGREVVVAREYARFCVEVMRWDYERPDEDGCPGDLPPQLLDVRIEHWVERPLRQALREAGGEDA